MKVYNTFISYCHKDTESKIALEKWLNPLSNRINIFSDTNINGGEALFNEINSHLNNADIVLLLFSQDYLYSSSCKAEMEYVLSKSSEKTIIPIILKICTWLETGCKELMAIPKDGKPINEWDSIDKGWLDVYQQIKNVLDEKDSQFSAKETFLDEIQKIEFVKENHLNMTLNDTFVFPNLKKSTRAFETEIITEDYFFESAEKSILITGIDTSGKTALARWLFIKYLEKNHPLLIDGNYILQTKDFMEIIKKDFENQINGDFSKWFEKNDKIAIIDNFHHRISNNFLEFLKNNFSKVIITMNDQEFLVYFKDDKDFSEFMIYSIGQLSLHKQEELITKWVKQGFIDKQNESVDYILIDQLEEKVNNIISQNRIVPRFPFYILTILQSLEVFMPDNYRITAYGHCYQVLIYAQIIKKGIKHDQIDTCFKYLKELAFAIYKTKEKFMIFRKENYLEFKNAYKEKYIISENIINRIEDPNYAIIHISDIEGISFTLEYMYLFFIGKYLADSNDTERIENIVENINIRQNASIIIFTIHHTENKKLLEIILLHCLCLFDNIPPAELSASETKFMNDLLAKLPVDTISRKSIQKNRDEINHRKDEYEEKILDDDDESITLININKGLRIIDVLGQILKNRAGSFEKSYVQEILEFTIDLGLRIMNLFLSTIRTQDFEEWLIGMLEEAEKENSSQHNYELSFEKKKEIVEKNIQIFGYLVTVSMINRISSAIFSDKLTYETTVLSVKKNTPAYSIIDYIVNQSHTGVDVNHLGNLIANFEKSKNYWAKRTLSYYVHNFLNTHSVEFKKRQRIYDILGIKYVPNKTLPKASCNRVR